MIKKLGIICMALIMLSSVPVYAEDDIPTTPTQETITNISKNIPTTGPGLCAAWVENVFAECGYRFNGNANDLWKKYCHSTDMKELEPGMLIAVNRSSSSGLGYLYGHVGIYIGDGYVIHNSGTIQTDKLEDWIEQFNYDGSVAWGYPDGVQEVISNEQSAIVKQLVEEAKEQAANNAALSLIKLHIDLNRTAKMSIVNDKEN